MKKLLISTFTKCYILKTMINAIGLSNDLTKVVNSILKQGKEKC